MQGKQSPIDIVSILQPPHPRRYAFLSITLGLIANLDIGTEHLRCFKCKPFQQHLPARYMLQHTSLVFALSHTEVCVLPATLRQLVSLVGCQCEPCRLLRCRWMGDMRFTVGAVQQIMGRQCYSMRLAYLPTNQTSGNAIQKVWATSNLRMMACTS